MRTFESPQVEGKRLTTCKHNIYEMFLKLTTTFGLIIAKSKQANRANNQKTIRKVN